MTLFSLEMSCTLRIPSYQCATDSHVMIVLEWPYTLRFFAIAKYAQADVATDDVGPNLFLILPVG